MVRICEGRVHLACFGARWQIASSAALDTVFAVYADCQFPCRQLLTRVGKFPESRFNAGPTRPWVLK